MEKMKMRFTNVVASKLSAAPNSTAKFELVEELSDNLYQRYQDMVASGMAEDEAFQKAVDNLGDTDELVAYLNSLQPDEPLPKLVLHPDKPDSSLDDMLRDLDDIVKGALQKAKNAIEEAKETLAESGVYRWKSKDGKVEVQFGDDVPDGGEAPAGDAAPDQEEAPEDSKSPNGQSSRGWDFSADIDPDAGKFFACASPKGSDETYGFGYDREQGGFYKKWGEPGDAPTPRESVPAEAPISAQSLKGIDIQVDGDITIRMTEDADGDVVIDGDIEELDVSRSEDGVLLIRQGRTASSSFFFRRGLASADVDLSLPCRKWDFLRISSSSGDVEIDGDAAVGLVTVSTASGDLTGRLTQCDKLYYKSASGDLEWGGDLGEAQIITVSGDITFSGHQSRYGNLVCKTTSGDVDWEGSIADSLLAQTTSGDITLNGQISKVQAASMSGGVRLESSALPQQLDLSSKSGDCEVRIPDSGPFTVRFKTTSGTFRSDFFTGAMGARSNTLTYHGTGDKSDTTFDYEGGGPTYRFSSISGDLYLYKY